MCHTHSAHKHTHRPTEAKLQDEQNHSFVTFYLHYASIMILITRGQIWKRCRNTNVGLQRTTFSWENGMIRRTIRTSNEGNGRRTKATTKVLTSIPSQNILIHSTDYIPTQSTNSKVSISKAIENEGKTRTSLTMSTVERGTTYEEHVKTFLQTTFPKMDLMRIGGAHDGGIDLTGWWWSPLENTTTMTTTTINQPAMERIRITVQCKSEARKLGPRHIREIHGTMITKQNQFNSSSKDHQSELSENVILPSILDSSPISINGTITAQQEQLTKTPSMAILASSSGFSKQCLLQAISAPFPLLLIHLLFPDEHRENTALNSCYHHLNQSHESQTFNSSRFAHPTIVANDALLNGLLRSQLEVRWSSSIVQPTKSPIGNVGKGKMSSNSPLIAPIKVDMPALYLSGKKLSN